MIDFVHSELELAWAAGFFDGEGCTYLNKKYVQLTITQANIETLIRFKNAVGAGKISKPRLNANGTTIWQYFCSTGRDVELVISRIYIYLSPSKQKQMNKILSKGIIAKPKRVPKEDVEKIIKLAEEGMKKVDIAKKFNVTDSYVCYIVNGKRRNGTLYSSSQS